MQKDILDYAEMTEEQLEFLCNLIEKERPKKLVEIGIAAGGTSVVLIDKLESIACKTEMYSIDKAEKYYCDESKKVGYLIEQYKEKYAIKLTHKTLTCGVAPNFLEQIGTGIDFLILDTVHSLPGEMLDFLACYPYLASNAIVVVHDIILNHLGNKPDSYATNVLLNSVVGDKLTPIDIGKEYPGIGAFRINEDTSKYIDDVFNSLMITWKYVPYEEEIKLYLKWYKNFYNEKQIYIFNEAVEFNKKTLNKKRSRTIEQYVLVSQFIRTLYKKNVYIYGKGFYGCIFQKLLEDSGVNVKEFIVSDGQLLTDNTMYFTDALNKKIFEDDNNVLLIGVNSNLQEEIISKIERKGIDNYIIPSENLLKDII